MWFKNTFVYQIRDSAFSDRLAEQPDLETSAFHDCLPTQPVSTGLVSPHPALNTQQLTTREFIVWQVQRQERLLPGPVVNETLQERVEALQQSEDRKVGRNERTDLKEAITLELLPRAFTRNQRHMVILDRLSGWLFVQCGSESRADEVTAFLRDALGELPIVPLGSLCQPNAVWSDWLTSGDLPPDTEIQDEMALYHPAEDATIKVKQLPWDSAEIQQLLANGYRPTQIMLSWQEQLNLQVNEKSVFKRLRFSDDLMEQAAQEGSDSVLAEWEASLHLMTATLRRFSDQYYQWCGAERSGEPNPEKS